MREYRRIPPPIVKQRIQQAERARFFIVSTSGPLAFLLKEETTSRIEGTTVSSVGHQVNTALGEQRRKKNGMRLCALLALIL
jgi:hypothetical protein